MRIARALQRCSPDEFITEPESYLNQARQIQKARRVRGRYVKRNV
jgi:hypothetical protein